MWKVSYSLMACFGLLKIDLPLVFQPIIIKNKKAFVEDKNYCFMSNSFCFIFMAFQGVFF